KGGKLAFFGRPEPDAVNFFSGITQSTFREGANPAEFFLAALEKREPAAFEEGYGRSEYRKREIEEKASDLRKIQIDTIPPKTPRKFAWRQFTTATKRYLKIKVRDTSNTLILLLQAPIIGLLQYLVFEEKSPALMFMLIVSAIWFGCSNASREIVSEQAIFKRERMVNLTLPAYIFSKILVLFLLCVLQCTILLSIVFSKVDFDENFWRIDALMILVSFSSLCMGLFISSLVKSTDAAVALIPIVLIPQVLFAGLVIPVGKMPSAAKPFTYFMISRYGFEGFAEFENCAVISEMTKVKTLFKCREIIGFTGQDMVPITDIFLILLTVGLIFIFSSMVLL
ncbi:MAG: ABC transporter permease, partial [Deltaproteobacteria bacterium]|nr:ABC transporter permease [Deltaproteobacteria bacterium]